MAPIIMALLPLLLKIVDMIITNYSNGEEVKQRMRELIKAAKDDANITVTNEDKKKSHRDKIKEQLKDE